MTSFRPAVEQTNGRQSVEFLLYWFSDIFAEVGIKAPRTLPSFRLAVSFKCRDLWGPESGA